MAVKKERKKNTNTIINQILFLCKFCEWKPFLTTFNFNLKIQDYFIFIYIKKSTAFQLVS